MNNIRSEAKVEARIANLRVDGRIAAGFYTSRENKRNPNVGIRSQIQRFPVSATCKPLIEFLRTTAVEQLAGELG